MTKFRIDYLFAFGIGAVTSTSRGGGGAGCFVATIDSHSNPARQMTTVLGILIALGVVVLRRLQNK